MRIPLARSTLRVGLLFAAAAGMWVLADQTAPGAAQAAERPPDPISEFLAEADAKLAEADAKLREVDAKLREAFRIPYDRTGAPIVPAEEAETPVEPEAPPPAQPGIPPGTPATTPVTPVADAPKRAARKGPERPATREPERTVRDRREPAAKPPARTAPRRPAEPGLIKHTVDAVADLTSAVLPPVGALLDPVLRSPLITTLDRLVPLPALSVETFRPTPDGATLQPPAQGPPPSRSDGGGATRPTGPGAGADSSGESVVVPGPETPATAPRWIPHRTVGFIEHTVHAVSDFVVTVLPPVGLLLEPVLRSPLITVLDRLVPLPPPNVVAICPAPTGAVPQVPTERPVDAPAVPTYRDVSRPALPAGVVVQAARSGQQPVEAYAERSGADGTTVAPRGAAAAVGDLPTQPVGAERDDHTVPEPAGHLVGGSSYVPAHAMGGDQAVAPTMQGYTVDEAAQLVRSRLRDRPGARPA
ncbi:hypothetical protein [Micromonospora sp. NPDC005652]|uniref:hypothetical protein n=1 Tax=Micromonospora sp. NPDC005652 TaxID=3157046 RepID=UPI003407B91C